MSRRPSLAAAVTRIAASISADLHSTLGYVLRVWADSDADATKRLYERLQERGPRGEIALNLFRANKTSTRAKVYRTRLHRGASYDRKEWSIANAISTLTRLGADAGITWGWKGDPGTPRFSWVIYVDLPTGQVSFHQATRGPGPDYAGDWDGQNISAERIIRWCAALLDDQEATHFALRQAERRQPTQQEFFE